MAGLYLLKNFVLNLKKIDNFEYTGIINKHLWEKETKKRQKENAQWVLMARPANAKRTHTNCCRKKNKEREASEG